MENSGITWEYILQQYEFRLNFLRDRKSHYSLEYRKGFYHALRDWVQYLQLDCTDFPKVNYENETFSYRGKVYKVEFDDYGQQICLKLDNGKIISGGSFNSFPEKVWALDLDPIIDEEILGESLE